MRDQQPPTQLEDESDAPPSTILGALRALMPRRSLTFREALRHAERQAEKFLEICGHGDGPVPDSIITQQPRISVVHIAGMHESGSSTWTGRTWSIELNAHEPFVRRRFTLAHEYKHILDAPFDGLYAAMRQAGDHQPLIEQICDYFAACLLMPKSLVLRAWTEGITDPVALADYFDTSTQAMRIRLRALGLTKRPRRDAAAGEAQRGTDSRPPHQYWRSARQSFAGASP